MTAGSLSAPRFGVVLLAAGASSRMGKPKLLLPWGRTSVIGHLINQWRRLPVEQIAIVCAANDIALSLELDRIKISPRDRIMNPHPEQGMFSSIRCAASWNGWNPRITHWVFALGDQPHLQQQTLEDLLDFATANPDKICHPGRQGRPKHPVALPAAFFTQLDASAASTLKEFLQARPEKLILREINDPGLDLDLDQPADYERALQLYFGTSGSY